MKSLFSAAIVAIFCCVAPAMAQDDDSWKKAVENYRQQIRSYHFADAYSGMNKLIVVQDSWKQSRSTMMTNAHRLMNWKTTLINDLNDRHYLAPLRDKYGIRYLGIKGANEQSLLVKVSYGIVELPWTRFRREALIHVASSFITKGSPDAASRESLSQLAAAELAHPAADALTAEHTQTTKELSEK